MDSSSTLNSAATNALTLAWAFGFNKDVVGGVHSLCADGRQALFYVAAHTGVIYDYAKRAQEFLQVLKRKTAALHVCSWYLPRGNLGNLKLLFCFCCCACVFRF